MSDKLLTEPGEDGMRRLTAAGHKLLTGALRSSTRFLYFCEREKDRARASLDIDVGEGKG